MGQSLSRVLIHGIFSTKNREPFPRSGRIREEMNAYLAGSLRRLECPAVIVGSVEDHVHFLCTLSKNLCTADLMEKIKANSSKWVKKLGRDLRPFGWQNGYGAFSVSPSSVPAVRGYIVVQEKRHRKTTFKQEFLAFLKKYEVAYDKRYIWN